MTSISKANHSFYSSSAKPPILSSRNGSRHTRRRGGHASAPGPEVDKFTSGNAITPLIDGPAVFSAARNMIKSADSVIQLEMFDLGHKEMVDLMCHEAKQGVTVQVMLDPNPGLNPAHTADKQNTVKKLRANGVEVTYFPLAKDKRLKPIDHIKLLIVDGKSVLIGGMNWGPHSPLNHDADIKIEGEAVNYYRNIFKDAWKRSGGRELKSEPPRAEKVPGATGEIEGIATEYKQVTGIKQSLMKKIKHANKSIHMETFVLSDREVIESLVKAKKRGVDVKILLDPSGVNSGFSPNGKTYDTLQEAGINVKWYNTDTSVNQKLHAKWGVFDGNEMVIGSANWSYKGLQINREIGAALKEKDTVSTFEKQFANDWEKKSTDQIPE